MKRLSLFAIVITQFFINSYAQDKKVTNFELEIANRKAKYETIIPESLSNKFLDKRATGYITQPEITEKPFLKSILSKVKLVSISRDVLNNYEKVIRKRGKIVGYSFGRVFHPGWYQSIIVGKKLYVIEGFHKLDGLSVFNEFIKDLKVSVNNADEARQILDFYLLFYTNHFRDWQEKNISKVEDIPEKYRNEKLESVELVRDKIHPLKITTAKDVYQIEFFTWENFPRGEVKKWKVEIAQNGEIKLAVELLTII